MARAVVGLLLIHWVVPQLQCPVFVLVVAL
jgi:hypothetical protein